MLIEIESQQFIRALRGRRSQVALSRRLGYRSNPVAEWEGGRRFPTAAEALRACMVCGVDVHQAFEDFHPAAAPSLGDAGDAGVAAWLSEMRGTIPLLRVAERTGRSRYAVARWLSGQARPRLPDFFALVQGITGRLPDLVAGLVPIASVPALEALHASLEASRRLALDQPWAPAVMCLLETEDYRALPAHDPAFVARVLGIGVPVAQACLDALLEARIVRRVGAHLVVQGELTVDTRATPGVMEEMKRHWVDVGLERLVEPRAGDYFGFNVFSVSRADLQRIRGLHEAYFRQVRALVGSSEPREVVALVNVQLMDWDAADSHIDG